MTWGWLRNWLLRFVCTSQELHRSEAALRRLLEALLHDFWGEWMGAHGGLLLFFFFFKWGLMGKSSTHGDFSWDLWGFLPGIFMVNSSRGDNITQFRSDQLYP